MGYLMPTWLLYFVASVDDLVEMHELEDES